MPRPFLCILLDFIFEAMLEKLQVSDSVGGCGIQFVRVLYLAGQAHGECVAGRVISFAFNFHRKIEGLFDIIFQAGFWGYPK